MFSDDDSSFYQDSEINKKTFSVPNYWDNEISSVEELDDVALIRIGLTSLQVNLKHNPIDEPNNRSASMTFRNNTIEYFNHDYVNNEIARDIYYPMMFIEKQLTDYESSKIIRFDLENPNSNCPEVKIPVPNKKGKFINVRGEALLYMLLKNAIQSNTTVSSISASKKACIVCCYD